MVAVTAGTRERLTIGDSSSHRAGQKARRQLPRRAFSRAWDTPFDCGIVRSQAGDGTKGPPKVMRCSQERICGRRSSTIIVRHEHDRHALHKIRTLERETIAPAKASNRMTLRGV